jgi:hypothetical protein
MILVLVWIVLAIAVGAYASSKGRSGVGFFFLSLLLSPLIGFLFALVAKTDAAALELRALGGGDMRKCPHCAELVKAEAAICRYC